MTIVEACFSRLMTAVQDNKADTADQMMAALAECVRKGDLPTVTTLGECQQAIGYPGYDSRHLVQPEPFHMIPRKILTIGDYAIMCVDPNDRAPTRFKFVAYDSSGNEKWSKTLPVA